MKKNKAKRALFSTEKTPLTKALEFFYENYNHRIIANYQNVKEFIF
jgi:hypothetical protein